MLDLRSLLLVALLSLCAMSATVSAQSATGENDAESSADTPRPPSKLSAEVQAAGTAMNAFTLDLYRAAPRGDGNFVISPASISMAMGIAYRGARGATAADIQRVLRYGQEPKGFTRTNGELMRSLSFAGSHYRLAIANSLFVQDGLPLMPDYQADMAEHYDAGVQRVDYRKDPEAARLQINGWVSDRTNAKIADLLQPIHINPSTRMVLVNAIYWRGQWDMPFEYQSTREEPFTRLDRSKAPAMLMQQENQFRVVERGGVQAISLPFASADVDMLVFLPRNANGLGKFEEKLDAAGLQKWLDLIDAAERRSAILTIPRFKVRTPTNGKDALMKLGLAVPFADEADFSGMATADYPGELPGATGYKIGAIVHEATLEVDEKGSEAAAATAIVMEVVVSGTVGPPPPPPVIFRADRPFLYMLRDRRSDAILFIGRFVDPAAQ